jgi:hypothetical protein
MRDATCLGLSEDAIFETLAFWTDILPSGHIPAVPFDPQKTTVGILLVSRIKPKGIVGSDNDALMLHSSVDYRSSR